MKNKTVLLMRSKSSDANKNRRSFFGEKLVEAENNRIQRKLRMSITGRKIIKPVLEMN